MKLLQRTNRIYLLFSALLLLIADLLLYYMMTSIMDEEDTEKLYLNKLRISRQLAEGKTVASIPPVLEIEELDGPQKEQQYTKTVTMFDPEEGEDELFREVTSIETIHGKTYRITVRQVILEPHDYIDSIGVALAIVLIMLLLGLLLINRLISRKLWKPFYNSLEILRKFSVQSDVPIEFPVSNISEFNELNEAL